MISVTEKLKCKNTKISFQKEKATFILFRKWIKTITNYFDYWL